MTSVTRPRARSALVSGVAVLLLAGAVGCDSGDDIGDSSDASPGSHGSDVPGVATVITIEHGEGMDAARQAKVLNGVTAVIDPWFDDAFLGEFPRSDFSSAFAAFTKDAAADAQRDLDLLSSSGIADQIDSARATNRRVRLDVFAPDGHPRGVTANFVLDFDTTGDLEEHLRVHGALYLAKDKGEWKVFGYDVDEAVKILITPRNRASDALRAEGHASAVTPKSLSNRPRLWRAFRLLALGVVLAVCATLAPSSTVKPTDLALVKIKNATSVDVSPDVVWILAVGSDARPGEDMTRVRGDALQLIGMNTKTGAAAAIGIPRDSYVSIPGVGSDRINAALYYGGPQLLGETVGELVGIVPDYVFVTRFEKFANMVNDIGGIEVDNPTYFSDTYLKPKGFEAGRQHLNGYLALAFSRIRKTLLRGDFDRSANQQRVLTGIQAKIRDRASVHGFIEKGVLSAMQNMATNASPAELYRLARAAAAVKPSLITTCVVLGGIGNIGGASVVLPYVDQAQRMGDHAREDATLESCD